MKKPLAILLAFSLLTPHMMFAQPEPCQDKEFLRLKNVNINDMTEREYQYFLVMSEECADDENENMFRLKLKPKLLWLIIGAAVVYSIYDEVIEDDEDEDSND